tara:strand:+ start:444 stop:683 length:240 start_codon:yes stop_codon:yes gene_type:complete
MEIISEYWHQILFVVGAVVVAVRLQSEVRSLRKDLSDVEKRDTYVEVVKLRAEVDVLNKQVSSLWEFSNKLRDKFHNGH